jgi:hypothetical protein
MFASSSASGFPDTVGDTHTDVNISPPTSSLVLIERGADSEVCTSRRRHDFRMTSNDPSTSAAESEPSKSATATPFDPAVARRVNDGVVNLPVVFERAAADVSVFRADVGGRTEQTTHIGEIIGQNQFGYDFFDNGRDRRLFDDARPFDAVFKHNYPFSA